MELYWIWLSLLKGIGPVTAKKLIKNFRTPFNVYNASKEDLLDKKMFSTSVINTIINSKSLENCQNIINICNKKNIKILTMADDIYPENVKIHEKTPILLYYRGNIIKNSMGVGIVGARRCTNYGKKIAVEAAEFLTEHNIPVISGMAKGIDGYAHTACLNAGGYSLAFLGNGVDLCYPKEHIKLMEKLIEKGAVISKYPPGIKPCKYNFPERNYILSAWCTKLLVVEASQKSGALITAKYAKDNNKQVYAVPNNIYNEASKGSNKLIYKGCKVYLSPENLLDIKENKIHNCEKSISKNKKYTSLEKKIMNFIEKKPKTLEEIIYFIKGDKQKIIETISIMELENNIETYAGKIMICQQPLCLSQGAPGVVNNI